MAGYNQMNRGYNEQPGIDWGKMALYGAGAALGYGVLRAGAMKLSPHISAAASKAKKGMGWATDEMGKAVDSVKAKMAKADAPGTSAAVASHGTSVGPMTAPPASPVSAAIHSAPPRTPHDRIPFSPPARAGLSTDPSPLSSARGSKLQAFALANPRAFTALDRTVGAMGRGVASAGRRAGRGLRSLRERLKPERPWGLEAAKARNANQPLWMGATPQGRRAYPLPSPHNGAPINAKLSGDTRNPTIRNRLRGGGQTAGVANPPPARATPPALSRQQRRAAARAAAKAAR